MSDLSHTTSRSPQSETLPTIRRTRELKASELWTLYDFETHARACKQCLDPYFVHKTRNSLCKKGSDLGHAVASLLSSTKRGTRIFDRAAMSRSQRLVHIDLPRGYELVRQLLEAVERSLRHPEQAPIVDLSVSHKKDQAEHNAAPRSTTPVRRRTKSRSTSRDSGYESSPHASPNRRRRSTVCDVEQALANVSYGGPTIATTAALLNLTHARRAIDQQTEDQAPLVRTRYHPTTNKEVNYPPSSYRETGSRHKKEVVEIPEPLLQTPRREERRQTVPETVGASSEHHSQRAKPATQKTATRQQARTSSSPKRARPTSLSGPVDWQKGRPDAISKHEQQQQTQTATLTKEETAVAETNSNDADKRTRFILPYETQLRAPPKEDRRRYSSSVLQFLHL